MKKDKLKIEKKILRLSFLGSLLFIIAEGVMAWITHSHSLLTDCLFDAADLVMIGPFLVLVPLLYKPVTEKHPYGYSQVESLFLLVKYSVLLALTCNLLVENIKLLVHGGHEVNAGKIAVFEFLVCIGCAVMYLILNHYSKKYESETIKAELYMWKLDVVSSLGVAVAFVVQVLLLHTKLHFLDTIYRSGGCGSNGNSTYKGAGRCDLPEHQESGFVCTGGRGVEPDPFHRR